MTDLSFLSNGLDIAIGKSLLGEWDQLSEIANKHGTYPSRVSRVRNKMIDHGIPVKSPQKFTTKKNDITPFVISHAPPKKQVTTEETRRLAARHRRMSNLEYKREISTINKESWEL